MAREKAVKSKKIPITLKEMKKQSFLMIVSFFMVVNRLDHGISELQAEEGTSRFQVCRA